MTTPRTVGRLPFQRIRPALPQLMLDCSALPTSPTVARQRTSTKRISPRASAASRASPRGPRELGACIAERAIFAATGPELDAVDRGADGDVAQREVVAHLDVGVDTRLDVANCLRSFGAMM